MDTTVSDAPLLGTKLFVPPPRTNRVPRSRLSDRIESAAGGTLTLISAAAGSGKSTLLADWVLSTSRRVGWLSLDAEDDDPRRFLSYVVAALAKAGAFGSGAGLAGVRSTSPEAIDVALTEILNAIAESDVSAALVLDDFHVIESESVQRIVQRIVDHLPPGLNLVIASRVDPPLALSRLRARHKLVEIRGGDLRFTSDEAARFFNESMGLGLTDAQVADLEQRTEGWAVGLQLAAISLRGQRGADDFIAGFSGTNRYVLDYLTDEVLDRQPPEIRPFLLETSILTQLSAPLCDAITGRIDSDRILQHLDATNLFLIPLDDVRVWYRYHHLFASLLGHDLERSTPPEKIADLHRRASAWYATNGMPEPALHHALAAGDDDRAATIVGENARSRVIGGDSGTIVRWMARLPRARVERDIDLLLVHALALTAEYKLDLAMIELDHAQRLLSAENRERCEGAVLSMRGLLEHLTGRIPDASATLERALATLAPHSFWYSMTSFNLGMAAFMRPDLRAAEARLRRATLNRDRPDGLLTAVMGQCYAGWICLWRGLPEEAIRMAREASSWIEARDATNATGRPLNSLAYSLLADAHRMRNETEKAREYAELALEFGRQGFFAGHNEATRLLAQIAEEQGEWDTAMRAARETLRGLRFTGNPAWLGPTRAMEYHVLWRRGQITGNEADLDIVSRWCDQAGFLDVERWRENMHAGLFSDYSLLIAARVLRHQGRFELAQRLLTRLLDEATRQERVPAQITLHILSALTEAALRDAGAAVGSMQRALHLASAPSFVRFFVDEGSPVVPLIERAMAGSADRGFAARVLSAFDVPLRPRQATDDGQSLTDREIEVLKLIAGGASNQEAASTLIVAPSTVKKHLENIYAKLGAAGRAQAVARARELKLF